MTRLADLRIRIESVQKLLDVVSALRSLAALRVRQTHQAVTAIRHYADIVHKSLGRAASYYPPLSSVSGTRVVPGKAVLAFFSEYGFVGAFNDQVMARAAQALSGDSLLFVVGTRGARIVDETEHDAQWSMPMPTSPTGIPDASRRIAETLYQRFEAGHIGRVDLVFGRHTSDGTVRPHVRTLLPLDFTVFESPMRGVPPLTNLPSDDLLDRLVGEYFYAALTLAATESLFAVNQARVTAMGHACHNIETKLGDLTRMAHNIRQEEITTELHDIIVGTQAQLME